MSEILLFNFSLCYTFKCTSRRSIDWHCKYQVVIQALQNEASEVKLRDVF